MPTAWVVIAQTDLNDYLVSAQVDALAAAALAPGQTNPFARVMPDVMARIRAAIAGCQRNRVSATANSVPPELKWAACLLTIEAMQTRVVGLVLTEEQKGMIRDAKDELKLIRECESVVVTPTDPVVPDVQRGGNIVVVTSSENEATPQQTSGLL